MTNNIKDIVDGLDRAVRYFEAQIDGITVEPRAGYVGNLAKHKWKAREAIAALTTLSEDNAAMKLEIERLKDDTPVRKLEGDAKWIATDLIEKIEAKDKEIERLKDSIEIDILTMKLSGNREEYYVQIKRGDKALHVRKYGQDYLNRAQYEADELRYLLLDAPKPYLLDKKYADDSQALKDNPNA